MAKKLKETDRRTSKVVLSAAFCSKKEKDEERTREDEERWSEEERDRKTLDCYT